MASKGLIPLVDLGDVNVETLTESERAQRAAKQIHEAFSTIGFVYLLNHGIPKEQIAEARKKSDDFFALPIDVKSAYTRKGNSNHGWVPLEMESLNPERGAGDYKEAFNATPKADLDWPDKDVSGFRDSIMTLFDSCVQLTDTVLGLMAIGLELELKAGQVRCGEHSDYGTITLLFQDGVGGLEVMNRKGEYQAATPVEGAVLVNIGDLMQRWTSDKLISTKHRVLIPEEEVLQRTVRRSMAFFVQPDDHCVIECLDGSNKYPPTTGLGFLNERFSATY